MPRRFEHDERRRPLREMPFSRLLPNLITIAGLCCGLTAVRFALDGKFEIAIYFIFAAAIIDGLDGRIARMLKATSVFGAQLDSLSDFLCFGVVPAMVMYHWQLEELHRVGWALVLLYVVCCALRLARFNTGLAPETPPQAWQKQFFVGVPSPAGGVMCLWPLIISLQFEGDYTLPAYLTAANMFMVALLMASRIPTFAAKNIRIKPEMILPVMVVCAIYVVMLTIEPWWMLSLTLGGYVLSIPFSMRAYKKQQALHAVNRAAASSPK